MFLKSIENVPSKIKNTVAHLWISQFAIKSEENILKPSNFNYYLGKTSNPGLYPKNLNSKLF